VDESEPPVNIRRCLTCGVDRPSNEYSYLEGGYQFLSRVCRACRGNKQTETNFVDCFNCGAVVSFKKGELGSDKLPKVASVENTRAWKPQWHESHLILVTTDGYSAATCLGIARIIEAVGVLDSLIELCPLKVPSI
jgi:hypothetical protein